MSNQALKESFLRQVRHGQRMDRTLCAILQTLPETDLKADRGSYFGSLFGILNHHLVADSMWLRRYRALDEDSVVLSDPLLNDSRIRWDAELRPSMEEMAHAADVLGNLILRWFESFPADRYGETFDYVDSSGERRSAVAQEAFEYLFVHQIHHRGQMSQILDSLGVSNNVADNGPFLGRP